MPTFDVMVRFWSDYESLSSDQKHQFIRARDEFVAIMQEWERAGYRGTPHFPRHLGVKPLKGYRNIWELAWAPDGRCTWEYGAPQRDDRCHVIWRRIGSHNIYDDP